MSATAATGNQSKDALSEIPHSWEISVDNTKATETLRVLETLRVSVESFLNQSPQVLPCQNPHHLIRFFHGLH